MTLFSYRAINEDGKEVRGTIDSIDADAARKAVEDLHLEVVDISEATRNKPAPATQKAASGTATTFAFEGKDGGGITRRGTIQAATKREAFEKLKNDQKLTLLMLAPMGTLPKYNDPDLSAWQGPKQPQPAPAVQIPVQSVKTTVPSIASVLAQKPKATIAFTTVPEPVKAASVPPATAKNEMGTLPAYHSISATLRLYAAWLLAWYGLFVAVGYYATERILPWDIPFVQAFFVSPLIFSFTVAIFLFLLLTEIHRVVHGRLITGTLLTLAGGGLFVAFRMSL